MTNTTINSRCTPYNINTVLPLLYGIGIKLTNNTNNVKAITIQIYNCRYEFSILIFFVCGRKRKRKKVCQTNIYTTMNALSVRA